MDSLLQEAQAKVMPLLSSIVGNETIVTLMTAYHLAVSTLLDASSTDSGFSDFSYEPPSYASQHSFDGGSSFDEYHQGGHYQQQQQHRRPVTGWHMVGMGAYYIFSFVHSMVSQILHAQLSSVLSPSATSLASFVLTCLVGLLLVRLAISLVMSVFRSVLWLLQTAVFMTLVAAAIWFFYHMTSSGGASSTGSSSFQDNAAWNQEYQRQHKEFQKMLKNR